ncbi:unnamed protein product [Didymodactylos carnosus]|nr:unnamed protein product [Didymodactylos carnosus]CAF4072217.1 unnamed protein product [Didymodactylos carnosus]
MTPKQRARATETQSKRQGTVTKINEQISLIQNEYNIAKKTYQKKAKSIYLECQVEEQQRLDLIKETLIDFCHAIQFQIDEQSDLDNIYSALVEHIETRQNTSEDITYWVQSYGIADQTTDSICEDLEQTSILSKSSKVKKQLVEESTANTASLAATVMNTSTVSKNAEKNQYESSVTGQTIVSKKAQKKEQEAILEDEEEDEGAKTKVKRTKSINSKKIHLEADEISTTTANVLASV